MSSLIEIDADHMALNDGQFDSRYRYIREAISSDVVLVIPNGESLKLQRGTINGKAYCMWRWKIGDATLTSSPTTAYSPNIYPPDITVTAKGLAL